MAEYSMVKKISTVDQMANTIPMVHHTVTGRLITVK